MAFQFPDPNVQDTVINPITGSEYVWIDPPGKWVIKASSSEISDIVYEGDSPPDPRGDYKLWYSTDTLELYFWYEDENGVGAWVPTSTPITMLEDLGIAVAEINTELQENNFKTDQLAAILVGMEEQIINCVSKTGGDIMEGPLQIIGPRKAGDDANNPDLVSSLEVLSIDNAQNSGLHLRHSGTTKLYVGADDLAIAADIKFNRGAGTVIKTNVQDIFSIGQNEVAYLGETIEEEDLVTKKYVDDADEVLRQGIIELEEEIEALAPTTERGSWTLNLAGTVANDGQFTMYDGLFGSGQPNGKIQDVKSIWFNELDTAGTPHGFAGVEEGDLLELFVDGSHEYGLWSVVGTPHDQTGGASQFWVIDVSFQRTLEDDTSFNPGDVCRLKIFKAPEGGSASEFVKKSGDTMSGDLDIDRSTESTNVEAALALIGSRSNITNAAATIAFENSQSSTLGYLTYRSFGGESFFKFNRDLDLNNKVLRQIGEIRMTPGGSIGAGSNQRLTFNNANSGNEATGLLVVPRPADNRRGFAIRGNDAFGDEKDMFYSYSNVSGTPDAVNYVGKMDSDSNLVNKSYVDDKMAELLAKIEELEMTSGTMESYQFRMNNKTTGGSSSIGSQLFINEIMSCDNDGDNWNGQNTHLLSSEYRHIYVCFEDGYRLNSTGQMSVVRYSSSNQYDIRNSNVGTFNISGVEVCPPDKSSGKNIYRAVIQLDAYKPGTDAFYPSWSQGNVYVTFSGGSLTKVS